MKQDEDMFEFSREASEVISYELPEFRNWSSKNFYDYEHEIVDYEDLEKLNQAIRSARLALFQITDKINSCERVERLAKTEYERKHRRAYLQSKQKTETAKKAMADLECEDLEDKAIVYEQLRQELTRMSNSIRLELQTLQTLGNNIRQQMKME